MNIEKSKDGTVKFNFTGEYSGVLIPLSGKNTLCLSSQIGCPMGCKFCFSGKRKFEKNLSFEELKEQLDVAIEYLDIKDLNCRENKKGEKFLSDYISTMVFMGMGEPLLNLENVLKFCDYVNEFYGYAYSRLLISTCGVIPKMREVINNVNKIQLAVSLHSPVQEIRDKIMPGVSQYKIEDLMKVCNEYNEKYRQKIMIEYLMIGGLTDRDSDLSKLIELGLDKRTNFNLIPLNSSFELDGKKYEASLKETMEKFREELMNEGYKCFTRTSMGSDIEAACGMLR